MDAHILRLEAQHPTAGVMLLVSSTHVAAHLRRDLRRGSRGTPLQEDCGCAAVRNHAHDAVAVELAKAEVLHADEDAVDIGGYQVALGLRKVALPLRVLEQTLVLSQTLSDSTQAP